MSDQTITSLIEKLEGAEVGSRELDALVHVAVANDPNTYVVEPDAKSIFSHKPGWYRTGNDLSCLADPVTTSLDAALALAERVLPKLSRIEIKTYVQGEFHHCTIETDDDEFEFNNCRTPSLALCAALLRAQSEARV